MAAILGVALESGNLDASEPDANVVTGTVVVGNAGYIEIDEGKNDGRSNFGVFTYDVAYHPKVGERVRVHYHATKRGKVYADKIEKVGKGEIGSNKR